MKFSRKPGSDSGPGRHTRSGAGRRQEAEAAADIEFGLDERAPMSVPDFGPYDVEVAPEDGLPRLDLGSLRVPNLPGVTLGIETTPQGQPVRVQLEHEGSRLQLSAFAAPRSAGIWDEVRAELVAGALGSGAKVVEVDGEYGPALAARLPGQNGGVVEVRHIGIDGPRWFVQAVLIGPAAVDPAPGPLHEVLRGLVVDRGVEARPVREALPLQLPAELQARLVEAAAAQAARRAQGAAPAGAAPAGPGAATARGAPARPAPARPAGAKRAQGRGERA